MSFYLTGTKRDTETQNYYRSSFLNLDFADDSSQLTHLQDKSFLYCKSPSKCIGDIFIPVGDGKGSWVLLVGTPVINADSEIDKGRFANELLINPLDTMRHKVDGQFALVAFDGNKNRFIAATDWNSLIPIYYAEDNNRILISNSELIVAKLLKRAIDPLGFSQSIHYGAVWGTRTRFKNLHKLEPCEIITFDATHGVKQEKYWVPSMEEQWTGTFNDIAERWLDVMRSSINTFISQHADCAVSSDLTGGEDSRMVAAILHDMKVPFKARVAGDEHDSDVTIAREVAKAMNLELSVEKIEPIACNDLSFNINPMLAHSDGYGSFFTNSIAYMHEQRYRPMEYTNIHFCGLPGGGQFRGANYIRAKLLFPSRKKRVDYRAYTERKFLLDIAPNLMKTKDSEYYECVFNTMKSAIDEVLDFPAGIQIDHIMRTRYGCLISNNLKRPFYFAFAPRDMARSTYQVPAHMKMGGRLYKALIERLAPDIAWIKTQAGVPTVRKTALRLPIFLPEYYSILKKSVKGVARQKLGRVPFLMSKGYVNEQHHLLALHKTTIDWLLNTEPYSKWFSSSSSMFTGDQYNPGEINILLDSVRRDDFDQIQLLGRIVNQELAIRYVQG